MTLSAPHRRARGGYSEREQEAEAGGGSWQRKRPGGGRRGSPTPSPRRRAAAWSPVPKLKDLAWLGALLQPSHRRGSRPQRGEVASMGPAGGGEEIAADALDWAGLASWRILEASG